MLPSLDKLVLQQYSCSVVIEMQLQSPSSSHTLCTCRPTTMRVLLTQCMRQLHFEALHGIHRHSKLRNYTKVWNCPKEKVFNKNVMSEGEGLKRRRVKFTPEEKALFCNRDSWQENSHRLFLQRVFEGSHIIFEFWVGFFVKQVDISVLWSTRQSLDP